ncbi:MAG: hypothetical protein HGA39_06975 [Coriobacteriia bacterium]|nr:hypothetical protein [Coriobacteriia bacterium]
MVHINLLPRAVLNRRRYERWYRYIFIIAVGLVALVLLLSGALWLMVQQKTDTLQSANEQVQQYRAQSDALAVFEQNTQTLQARQAAVQAALSQRVDMGKLANNISLVLPSEVWLKSITIGQESGVLVVGSTPRSTSQSMDVAYKSIAKTLVRLGELKELSSVWLSSAANTIWQEWAVQSGSAKPDPINVVGFQITGKLDKIKALLDAPAASSTTSGTSGK